MRLNVIIIIILCCFNGVSCNKNKVTEPEGIPFDDIVKGRIFIGNSVNGGWILDLGTGHYSKIPNTNWGENNSYHSLADFSATALPYGNGTFVETIENCVVQFGNDKDCIVFHDEVGNITNSFEIPDIALGSAKLSPDGNLVAVVVENETRPFKVLNIYNRSGVLINTIGHGGINKEDFSWATNTEVVYISEKSLYISNKEAAITTFTGGNKTIGSPSVNSSGDKIVFTLGEDTSQGVEGAIWIINIDGTEVKQLTVKEIGFSGTPSHKSAIWSPDGKWIFVVDGTSVEGNAYIVPSNAEKVELTQKRKTLAQPVLSYFQEIFEYNSDDPIHLSSQFGVNYGEIYWIK